MNLFLPVLSNGAFCFPAFHKMNFSIANTCSSKFSFKRGDMILALEDYKIAAQLMPSKTDAMFEIGLFRFNNE